jgi:lipopolysaccharide/colanic/teichoic acid biosynthesis glycosyltransferase
MSMSLTPTSTASARAGITPRLVDAADAPPKLGEHDVRSRAGGADVGEALQFAMKRLVDLVAGIVLLVLLSPVWLSIAAAVWVSSPGPVIYRSRRIGLGGEQFGCLKFRTMRKGAEALQPQLEQHNEAEGAVFKMAVDPRVTRIGRWLRSSGLDELPQLLNVLRGSMSLVGPRPLPLRDCSLLKPEAWRRHSVLPGITGPWQLNPERHVDAELLGRLDLAYADHWTIWTDARVLGRTLWFGLRRLLSTDSELAAGG